MAPTVWFVTGNEHKAALFRDGMQPEFSVKQLEPREEIKEKRDRSVEIVVEDKLQQARQQFPDKPGFGFVTDVGLYINGLDDKPGALIKRATQEQFSGDFTQWCNALDENDSRDATVRMIIAAADADNNPFLIQHDLNGSIPEQPHHGDHGFAWDPVFIPDWQKYGKEHANRSLAQVPPPDKHDVLMQPAIQQFKDELQQRLQD